jgi:hypothetical protein
MTQKLDLFVIAKPISDTSRSENLSFTTEKVSRTDIGGTRGISEVQNMTSIKPTT